MTVTYRGSPIASIEHSRKDDTYLLIGVDGSLIAELKRHEYLSHPQLKSMRLSSNGRHRGSGQKNQRRSAGIASDPGGDDLTSGWTPISPRPSTVYYTGASNSNAGPSLSGSLILQMIQAGVFSGRPRPALKREGIVAGEIVGYRCWRVDHGLLQSVYQNDVWKPGDVLEGRELGDWDQRGIHAWKDAGSKEYHDYIRAYLNDVEDPITWVIMNGNKERRERRPAMATGTVFLWGDVVEHERGWRAEFARVRSLDWLYPDATMMGREQAALNELRRRYNVWR